MSWLDRVQHNLAPVSIEQYDVARMLKEWFYTGNYYDLDEPIEDCHLCDHPNIRYQFEIRNRHNSNGMLIGSECITRFEIPGLSQQGAYLDPEATRKQVLQHRHKLITDAQRRRVTTALLHLAAADTDFDISSFIDYYHDRKAFTPNQLSLLLWRLDKHGIEYRKADLKMIIRRDREKAQLHSMEDWKIRQIWNCMSSSQRQWYTSNVGPLSESNDS